MRPFSLRAGDAGPSSSVVPPPEKAGDRRPGAAGAGGTRIATDLEGCFAIEAQGQPL